MTPFTKLAPEVIAKFRQLLQEQQAVIVAHYYTNAEIQDLADATGGYVGDSIGMAQFMQQTSAEKIIVAGVQFMGETAKVLNPTKTVLMPTLRADCSLNLSCPAEEFAQFCKAYPDRTVVVYANTSVAVKAQADWVVTSSNAVPIVRALAERGDKILWASDRYLGQYVQQKTGADLIAWQGSCIVHENFKAKTILQLKNLHPDAAVLVHPETPAAIVELGDVVGSTSELIKASQQLPQQTMIVVTEEGVIHRMQQLSPQKTFVSAAIGDGRKCARCPWMSLNTLAGIERCLQGEGEEIIVPAKLLEKAFLPLKRMLDFATLGLGE